jgi:hypothetical protein
MSWLFPTPLKSTLNDALDLVTGWLAARIVEMFTVLFTAAQKILVTTPDVTRLPQVQMITSRTVGIVDAVFVLAFLTAGALIITAGGNENTRYTAKLLLPRLVFAFIAAHFSPLFCSKIITFADAIAVALAGSRPGRLGALFAVDVELTGPGGGGVPPMLFVILAAIITCLVAAVLFSFVTRLGVLVIIAAAGPLALACHALPQVEGVAALWWRSLIGCLAVPALQVLSLRSGETILLDPTASGFLFGRPGSGVMSLVVTISLLWITVKIPSLVARYVSKGPGPKFGGQVLRVVVIQRVIRLLSP